MQPLDFGKFIVQIIQLFWSRFIFFTECKRGQAVIVRRFGEPIRWRNRPRWYFKIPLIEEFDKVDMRKNYVCLNAHSFHTKELNDSVVPYNIIIDVQVEYQIINPLIIYDKYGFAEGESVATSIISNSIHKRLSEIIIEKGVNLEYKDVYELLADYVKTVTLGELTYDDSKDDDIHRCWVYRWIFRSKYNATHRLFDREKSISICNIVITSFDKNLSLRTTI